MKLPESIRPDPGKVRQLTQLIAQGEGSHLEFKRKASFPDKIVREMIAFANTKGGILLVGVSDDGQLAGLKYPEGESHVIRKALASCKPALALEETFICVAPERWIIQYNIAESKTKPHFFQSPLGKQAYVRVEDKSIRASKEMLEIARRSIKKKDILFHYGEHERLLVRYLSDHHFITLSTFRQISGLKKFYASRKLILLVLANVLKITPQEHEDIYSLVTAKE